MKYLLVFVAVLFIDIIWTKSIQAISRGRRWSASLFSSLLTGLGYLAVLIIINDPYTILVAMIAAFLGTFLMMGGSHDTS
jgi:hypothetical protein